MTREPVGAPIKVHGGHIMAVAYSSDGTRIASASSDNTIRVWDVAKIEARYVSNEALKVNIVLTIL